MFSLETLTMNVLNLSSGPLVFSYHDMHSPPPRGGLGYIGMPLPTDPVTIDLMVRPDAA